MDADADSMDNTAADRWMGSDSDSMDDDDAAGWCLNGQWMNAAIEWMNAY